MTLYRRWPDTQTLLADLMTREWGHVVAAAGVEQPEPTATPSTGSPTASSRTVQALRANELLRRIVDVDPEVLLPYLLDRRGRSQEMVAEALAALIAQGQRDESDPPRRPDRAGARPPAGLPRLHAVGAHHVRPDGDRRDADVSHLDAELRRAGARGTSQP